MWTVQTCGLPRCMLMRLKCALNLRRRIFTSPQLLPVDAQAVNTGEMLRYAPNGLEPVPAWPGCLVAFHKEMDRTKSALCGEPVPVFYCHKFTHQNTNLWPLFAALAISSKDLLELLRSVPKHTEKLASTVPWFLASIRSSFLPNRAAPKTSRCRFADKRPLNPSSPAKVTLAAIWYLSTPT